ncbi:hypothetical protein CMK22_18640 [Candidatus Poribacteria bacterium]|nr:hypothetical protein [Candidatus Poribacteria bacterium]
MPQTVHKMRQRITKNQLMLVLDSCLNDQEIVGLAKICGIHHSSFPNPEIKNRVICSLCQEFFDQSSIYNKISRVLGKKSKDAIRRIKHMGMDEISMFFGNLDCLRTGDDELGQTLWAMLMDSRQQVQNCAHSLLTEWKVLELAHGYGKEALGVEDRGNCLVGNEPINQNDLELSIDLPVLPKSNQKNRDNTFSRSVSPQSGTDCLEDQSSHLNQHVLDLVYQCRNLQQQLQEQVNQNQFLEEENRTLKEQVSRYESHELVIEQLVEEKRILHLDLAEVRSKLERQLTPHLEWDKAALATGFQSLEQSADQAQHVFDQLCLDFEDHLNSLQQISQDSTANLDWIQQRIASLGNSSNKKVNYTPTPNLPRVGIFVDVQNMFYAAKDRYAGRLDYIKLLDLMVGPRQLTVAYAYIVQIPEIDQSSFVSLLEHNGYTIRTKDLRLRGDGSAKGDWDVGIAVDIAMMLDSLDVVALASGDGDFCELAELVKRRNKRIEVAAFSHNTSMDLIRSADEFLPISNEMII